MEFLREKHEKNDLQQKTSKNPIAKRHVKNSMSTIVDILVGIITFGPSAAPGYASVVVENNM